MASIVLVMFILCEFLLQNGHCTPREFILNREIERLAAATRIILQYYSERASALSLIRLALHPHKYYKQSEIINHVLLTTDSTITYVLEEPKYMSLSPFLRTDAILFLDGYESFR